jgi:hypothetical protein
MLVFRKEELIASDRLAHLPDGIDGFYSRGELRKPSRPTASASW